MNLFTIFYTVNNFLVITLSFLFMFTAGLRVESGSQGVIYTSELLSSGIDDNSLIHTSILLYGILLFIRMYKIQSCVSKKEIFICLLFFLIQLVCLMLIDAGSIFETIVIDNNFILGSWLLAFILSPILVILACRKNT